MDSSTSPFLNLRPLLNYASALPKSPPPVSPKSYLASPLASPNFRSPFENYSYFKDLPVDGSERAPPRGGKERNRPSFTRKGSANAWWRSLDPIPETHKDVDSGYSSEMEGVQDGLLAQRGEEEDRTEERRRLVLGLVGSVGLAAFLVALAVSKGGLVKGLESEYPPMI